MRHGIFYQLINARKTTYIGMMNHRHSSYSSFPPEIQPRIKCFIVPKLITQQVHHNPVTSMFFDERIRTVSELFDHKFADRSLCAEALQMAAPKAHVPPFGSIPKNNRLAVLGDAILDLVLCKMWFLLKDSSGRSFFVEVKTPTNQDSKAPSPPKHGQKPGKKSRETRP